MGAETLSPSNRTELATEISPLTGLCRCLSEKMGLEIEIRPLDQYPNVLRIDASRDVWERILKAQGVLCELSEYQALEMAADGAKISRLGTDESMGKLIELLSICDRSIIPEELGDRMVASALREETNVLEIGSHIRDFGFPGNLAQRALTIQRLRLAASEFGSEPISPEEVQNVISGLMEKHQEELRAAVPLTT